MLQNGDTQFSYRWQHDAEENTLSFVLSQPTIESLPVTAPRFSSRMLNREIEVALQKQASIFSQQGIKVNIRKLPQQISYSVSASNQEIVDQAMKKMAMTAVQAQQAYFSDHYFIQFIDFQNREFVQNDYAKYVSNSVKGMEPIVTAIKATQKNPNDLTEFVETALTWIQSVPYNNFLNRIDSNGAGFASPVELLTRNLGDCDSKSTLFAALLRAYNKNIQIHMVLLSDHALLAADIPHMNDKRALRIDGRRMVLLEPTGPADFGIGEIDDKTELALKNRQFSTLKL